MLCCGKAVTEKSVTGTARYAFSLLRVAGLNVTEDATGTFLNTED